MTLSRRTVLRTSTLTGLLATLPWQLAYAAGGTPQAPLAAAPRAKPRQLDLADMNIETFLPHLNTRFQLWLGAQRFATVVLVEVNRFTPPEDGTLETASQDAFTLVFRGPRWAALLQETYTLKHAALGTFPLLLVPAGIVRQQTYYAAVFNRLRL